MVTGICTCIRLYPNAVTAVAKQVRLVLPEGLELSKYFYFWLSCTLDRYLGDGATVEEHIVFRDNVFGVSLSATGLSEVSQLSWRSIRLCMEESWYHGVSRTR